MNRNSRGRQFAVGAAVLVVLLAVVGWLVVADDDEPSKTARPAPMASTPAGPDRDAWRAEFSAEQLQLFDGALRDWQEYNRLMAGFNSSPPKDVSEVNRTLERYHSIRSEVLFGAYVKSYVKGGVRMVHPPEALYVTGRKARGDANDGLVEFDQCTDYSVAKMERDGVPFNGAPTSGKSAILQVTMSGEVAEGGARDTVWSIVSSKVVDEPCE